MRCGTPGSLRAIRLRAQRSKPSLPPRRTTSKSPASPQDRGKRIVVDPRPVFERMATPDKAIDRLVELYGEATSALREAIERFLTDGVPPPREIRAKFRYPQLRVTYEPEGVPPSNQRAFAKFTEAGIYTTTVTQPAAFRGYLIEQLEPLVREFGAIIEVGIRSQEIPDPYVLQTVDELVRGGHSADELARVF